MSCCCTLFCRLRSQCQFSAHMVFALHLCCQNENELFFQRKERKKCAVLLFQLTDYVTTTLWSRNHANMLQNPFSMLTLLGYVTCLTNTFESSAPLKYATCSFCCSWLCGTCYCLMWSLAQIFPVCSDTAAFTQAFISGCCCSQCRY